MYFITYFSISFDVFTLTRKTLGHSLANDANMLNYQPIKQIQNKNQTL